MAEKFTIPLSEPLILGNEAEYCRQAVEQGWLTAGSYITKFEEMLSLLTGSPNVVAVANGTAALHLAALLSAVKPGTEVICPSISFAATVHAIAYCGAIPVFLDCDDYFGLCPEAVKDFVHARVDISNGVAVNRSTGRPISAAVPVHVLGNPVATESFTALLAEAGIAIFEDAAESLGSNYRNSSIHTGTQSPFGCLSFNGNKIVTSAGGGALLCQSEEGAKLARHLAQQAKVTGEFGAHDNIGFNYRLSNVHAAIGVAQLESFEERMRGKQRVYENYRSLIAELDEVELVQTPATRVNFWLIAIRCRGGEQMRNRIIAGLAAKGIESRPLWQPLYEHPAFIASERYKISNAQKLIAATICLPSSPRLSEGDIEQVVAALRC